MSVDPYHIDCPLAAVGAPARSIFGPLSCATAAWARPVGKHLWEPAEAGERGAAKCLILVSDIIDSEAFDILALPLLKLDRVRTRYGRAMWAGEWMLQYRARSWAPPMFERMDPRDDPNQPLAVFESPLAWLRADCLGALALSPAAYFDLGDVATPIIVENVAHGRRILNALRLPFAPPEIRVHEPASRAA